LIHSKLPRIFMDDDEIRRNSWRGEIDSPNRI